MRLSGYDTAVRDKLKRASGLPLVANTHHASALQYDTLKYVSVRRRRQ
jgi:hypothetical protein